MERCSYCGEEISYFFICPLCKEKFCKLHKTPLSHKCNQLEVIQPSQPINTNSSVLDITPDPISEPQNITGNKQGTNEETISNANKFITIYSKRSVSYIIGGFLIGLIFTNILYDLYNPLQNDYDLIKGNYLSIKSNYTALLEKQFKMEDNIHNIESINERLNTDINRLGLNNSRLKSQISDIGDELNTLNIDYIELRNLYNSLLANYTDTLNYSKYWGSVLENNITKMQIPSMNQTSLWLYQDDVERLYMINDFFPIHAALIRSLRAKAYGWSMGVIEVYANYTEAEKNIYNYMALHKGYVYIDAKSDLVFVSANQLLELGDIISFGDSNYRIEKIKIILRIQ